MLIFISFTGKELLRKKVSVVTLLLTAFFIGFYVYGLFKLHPAHGNIADDSAINLYLKRTLITTLGLFFAQMVAAFFVFFSSMGAINGEIENGLLLSVLSRPVPRWRIYIGKWIGLSVWSLLYGAILFWAIVLPVHYVLGLPLNGMNLLKAFLLFEWIPLLLLALSMLGSACLPTLGNGVACALLYGIGMFSGLFESVYNADGQHPGVENFSIFTSLLMPTDAIFRRMSYELIGGDAIPLTNETDRILGPFSSSHLPSTAFLVYTVVYLAILLAAGSWHFKRKDIS